jgi:hypothetical protein
MILLSMSKGALRARFAENYTRAAKIPNVNRIATVGREAIRTSSCQEQWARTVLNYQVPRVLRVSIHATCMEGGLRRG